MLSLSEIPAAPRMRQVFCLHNRTQEGLMRLRWFRLLLKDTYTFKNWRLALHVWAVMTPRWRLEKNIYSVPQQSWHSLFNVTISQQYWFPNRNAPTVANHLLYFGQARAGWDGRGKPQGRPLETLESGRSASKMSLRVCAMQVTWCRWGAEMTPGIIMSNQCPWVYTAIFSSCSYKQLLDIEKVGF